MTQKANTRVCTRRYCDILQTELKAGIRIN